jgi:uncharacterized protein (TIGR03437 family)
MNLAAVAVLGLGQSTNPTGAIAGAGYLFPGQISIAPGQVITIFFTTGMPAPARRPSGSAPGGVFCGTVTAITIQIPYDLQIPTPTFGSPGTGLFVTQNGVAGNGITLNPLFDQVHILTNCDTVIGGAGPSSGRCPWEVTHANGSLVSSTNPASGGEILTAYAVGLGATNPAAPTGQAVTQPTPTAETLRMGFNFQADAPPSAPPYPSLLPPPLYTGLTPGYPGLYQINFVVASIPPGLPPCGSHQGTTFVNTNLTVSVGGLNSFDGAELCVSVPERPL